MKLILMGTNAFVVPIFDAIKNSGHEILSVFTRAPKPVGRKHIMTKSPVHTWADQNGIPVHTSINEFDGAHGADFIVVISYGVILSDNVLSSAPCVNIHPSLLPRYRGPSPIRTAIYNGDRVSGVCLMDMTREMDAGDIRMVHQFDIGENDTNDMIETRVSAIASQMLIQFLSEPDKYQPMPQSGVPSYTRKFTGADEIIDWSRTPNQIHNQIRALGAGRTKINGGDVKITETRIENGELKITKIVPAGKKEMTWDSFLNGHRFDTIKIGE